MTKLRLNHPITAIQTPPRRRWVIAPLTLILVTLACQIFAPGGAQKPGKVLFADDFANPGSGWNQAATAEGETNYADGAYRILVNGPNMDIWAKANRIFTDVRIEVDAFKVGGDRNNRFGIICRASGANFYALMISSDGYYGIGKVKEAIYTLIGMNTMQSSQAIKTGSALNHLRADCIGETLTLYANGQKLAEVQDSDYEAGDVGLIAGTYDKPGTDIRFDDYVVYQP